MATFFGGETLASLGGFVAFTSNGTHYTVPTGKYARVYACFKITFSIGSGTISFGSFDVTGPGSGSQSYVYEFVLPAGTTISTSGLNVVGGSTWSGSVTCLEFSNP